MIKRNKLSLFLFAIVAMLTVYYINLPEDVTPKEYESGTRYQPFIDERSNIVVSRSLELEELEASIASLENSDTDIKKYEIISGLTEREIALEEDLRDYGYTDCLICISVNNDYQIPDITVKVYDEKMSKNSYVVIYALLDESLSDLFSDMYLSVEYIEQT